MIIKIYGKTADSFSMSAGNKEYDGYPVTGHGFSRDGDSIELKIDNETGLIQGWVPFTKEQIDEL